MKIFRIGNKFFAEELKSTNGTVRNDEIIQPGEGYEIWEGDLITIGNSILRLDEAAPRKALDKGFWKVHDPLPDPDVKNQLPADRRSKSPINVKL
jgi:pSer/pThr/pTyr-binding forkhead associated (FHA) protein